MEINPQLVRDLFAAARKMQTDLHSINSQCFALQSLAGKAVDNKLLYKAAENIEAFTKYIYDGCEGFPDVSKTLVDCQTALQSGGEWKEWSDYIGFYNKTKKGK